MVTAVSALDLKEPTINHGKPNGLHWFTAALFLIADLAGDGIVAFPVAMARAGTLGGTIAITLLAVAFCYTACILSNNWIIMCSRWSVYSKHCRKPYPEMAYRAIGKKARSLCSFILNIIFFGVAVVFCLLASYIINDFIISITNHDIGFCYVLLLVTLAIYPVTLLRSPQDFWWAAVLAMLTTSFSAILIISGSWLDFNKYSNSTVSGNKSIHFDAVIASLGTFMFGLGGHVVFPSIQHDMRYPNQFKRSVIFAFAAVVLIYLSVSLPSNAAYGNSLHDSVISSVQTGWIRQCANLLIAVHCTLTFIIVINPLNQEMENLVNAPHHFGWHRVVIRTIVILAVLFVAETIPKFGPVLNVIGGSTVGLTSALLPLLFNNYLNASAHDSTADAYIRPTFMQVLQRNSKSKLLIDFTITVISIIFGMTTTYLSVIEIASTNFTKPCYLSSVENVPRNISVGA
ncbi:Amino acid transporter AVT1C [Dirofilaria immitis]